MKLLLKIFKVTLISFVTITLLFAAYFFISNNFFLESENQDFTSYLNKNKIEIKDAIPENLFDRDFYEAQVFLLGEIHGYEDNQKLDKELLFFLNKKLGVRYYIAEMDSSTAKNLNNFLTENDKNENLLRDVVKNIGRRIPQQSSQQLFDKWNEIYDYNKNLPDSLKIIVLGIDTDFDSQTHISRDEAMLENFKKYSQSLKNEKFYGLFGLFHVLQKAPENTHETFAAGLKNSDLKTVSFVSYTLDSEMYLPKNPQFPTPENEKVDWINADGPLQLVKGITNFKKITEPKSITLFKLNAENSPYFNSKHLISVKSRIFGDNILPLEGTFTTDYFQYAFILRNSKALSKLE